MIALVVLLVVALVAVGPLITIWAINTLFGLTIAYTFKTWLAALAIDSLFYSRSSRSKD